MKNPACKTLIILGYLVLMSGCLKSQESATAVDSTVVSANEIEKASVDATTDALTSAIFDSNSVDPIDIEVLSQTESIDSEVEIDADDEHEADSDIPVCEGLAVNQECRSDGEFSVQSISYNRCLIEGTRTVKSGRVRLVYNNAECSLAEDGMIVRRNHNLRFLHLPSGKIRHVTSNRQINYKREVIGGGESLKNTETGLLMKIRGVNFDVFNEAGRKITNANAYTHRGIALIDKTDEGAAFVHGGVFVVDHNLAQFTAKYSPKRLKWISNCKCPVSGQLLYRYSGSRQGSGIVQFNGCGKALILKRNGESRELVRDSCLVDNPDEDPSETDTPGDLEEIDDSVFEDPIEDDDEF